MSATMTSHVTFDEPSAEGLACTIAGYKRLNQSIVNWGFSNTCYILHSPNLSKAIPREEPAIPYTDFTGILRAEMPGDQVKEGKWDTMFDYSKPKSYPVTRDFIFKALDIRHPITSRQAICNSFSDIMAAQICLPTQVSGVVLAWTILGHQLRIFVHDGITANLNYRIKRL